MGAAMLNSVSQDIRYAFRTLIHAPAFAIVTIATLGLAISASTVIFTIVDAVLLKPLPFPQAERLATIQPDSGSRLSDRYVYAWRSQSHTVADLAGWYDVRMGLTGRGQPFEVAVDRTTPNFFSVLGTRPLLGRTFTVTQDIRHVEPEAILSYGLWQHRFAGDSSVIGTSITLGDEPFTVVGVMQSGFAIRTNELAESRAELWTPFPIDPEAGTGMGGSLNVVGRLAGTVTFEQARAELTAIAGRLEVQRPSYTRDWRLKAIPLREATVHDVRPMLLLVFGAVGIVLLIACANIATLLLTRAVARSSEIATRVALGATRARLIQQFLVESLWLAAYGGAAGILLATWGTRVVANRLSPALDLPRVAQISLNLGSVAFAVGVTVLAVLIFGLLPAFGALSRVAEPELLTHARATSPGPDSRRSANVLIGAEIALALILLAGGGLLVRSFANLIRVDLGFRSDNVVTIGTTLSPVGYRTDERIRVFLNDVLTRTAAIPGVRATGVANYLPLSNVGEGTAFEIEGRSSPRPGEKPGAWRSIVGGRFFEAMGIPLISGRMPGPSDTERTQPVLLIDEELARRYWPNGNPVGARLMFDVEDGKRLSGLVIGVVGSVRWMATAARPPGTTYFWLPQQPRREITFVARVTGNTTATGRAIAHAIADVDAAQPVSEIRSLDDVVAADIARPRLTMLVLVGFAGAALLLAAVGVFGVTSFDVVQRTREIGVRVALGAQERDVLRLVMSRGLIVAGTGVLIGLVCAVASGRLIAGTLYGIVPGDPSTLIASALFVLLVATVAMFGPALRASRLNPLEALRRE
jgi:predicted permease